MITIKCMFQVQRRKFRFLFLSSTFLTLVVVFITIIYILLITFVILTYILTKMNVFEITANDHSFDWTNEWTWQNSWLIKTFFLLLQASEWDGPHWCIMRLNHAERAIIWRIISNTCFFFFLDWCNDYVLGIYAWLYQNWFSLLLFTKKFWCVSNKKIDN